MAICLVSNHCILSPQCLRIWKAQYHGVPLLGGSLFPSTTGQRVELAGHHQVDQVWHNPSEVVAPVLTPGGLKFLP